MEKYKVLKLSEEPLEGIKLISYYTKFSYEINSFFLAFFKFH